MKTKAKGASRRKHFGFTLIELLVVVATLAVLTTLLLPALAQTNKSALRTQCVNNLKRVNLSFHVWEGNQGGKYPTAVSITNGGAMENIYTQNAGGGGAPAGYGVTNVFCVMSNLLGAPKILACPADFSKTALPTEKSTTASGPIMTPATSWANFGNKNLSYFVEGNASDRYPKMILIGDRNIGTMVGGVGVMNMFNNGYANVPLALPGGNPTPKTFPWAWSDADIHQDVGNLGKADGSVQSASLGTLQAALNDTTTARGTIQTRNVILNMP